MARSQNLKRALGWLFLGSLALAACGLAMPARESVAQYPGHLNTEVKAGPVLRSVAVLEYTGDAGKPKASRLIPVSVFEDGTYQDGGLYLARPAPLALENGTEYQLMHSGKPEGIYEVATAERRSGDWFGYGDWKPLPPPMAFHPLKPSKIDPEVVDGESDRKPHFRKAAPDTDSPGGANAGQPPEDPDRPTLRKREVPTSSTETASNTATASGGDLETATNAGDPDRPKLTRGAHLTTAMGLGHLEDTPANLEQVVAVSDAENRPEHSFAFSWSNPEDAVKMQGLLQDIALKAIAKSVADEKAATAAKKKPGSATGTTTTHTGGQTATQRAGNTVTHSASTAGHTAAGQSAVHKKGAAKKAAAPAYTLTDVKFKSFELTYSGGATLVFTARTTEDDLKAHYVTVIAQPDIYGVPQVLFTQVTRADDLDSSPRLRLIDAVDAAADNRGELLFELRGATTRAFALYRVAGGKVDQMIATGPLPVGKDVAD
jgi:hypothetical protein